MRKIWALRDSSDFFVRNSARRASSKLEAPPGMIERSRDPLPPPRKRLTLRLGKDPRALLDLSVGKRPVSVQEIKLSIDSVFCLDHLGSPSVPGVFDEVKLSIVTEGVVIPEQVPLSNAEHPFEIGLLWNGPMKIGLIPRLSSEAPVVFREIVPEEPVGLLPALDPLKTHLFDEAVLEGPKESLNASFCLGGIGMDHIHSQFLQGPFKLGPGAFALELFLQGRLPSGFVGRKLIDVDTLREAVAQGVAVEALHSRESAFVIIETGEGLIVGIIDVTHEHQLRPPSLQPVMVRAIDLDHLSRALLTLPPLPVLGDPPLPFPKLSLDQPVPEGFSTQLDLVPFEEFLSEESRSKVLVVPLVESEHLLFELLWEPVIGRASSGAVNQSFGAFLPESSHDPSDLSLADSKELCGFSLHDLFLDCLLNHPDSLDLFHAHLQNVLSH